MENQKTASISINLNDGDVNISGSEEFVEKNMSTVFAFIEKAWSKKMPAVNLDNMQVTAKDESSLPDPSSDIRVEGKDKYIKLGLYSVDPEDGTISIHRKIPGKNNAERMKNVALIVLYEKGGAIEGAKLKKLCEKQGCWDGNNSSAIFERELTLFIKKKISPQKWTISLTIDGEQAAQELLETMANAKK